MVPVCLLVGMLMVGGDCDCCAYDINARYCASLSLNQRLKVLL